MPAEKALLGSPEFCKKGRVQNESKSGIGLSDFKKFPREKNAKNRRRQNHAMEHSIYLIEHKTRNCRYIGITRVPVSRRIAHHKFRMRRELNNTSRLYSALRKYGWDNFNVSVVDCVRTLKQAVELEKLYIWSYGANLNTRHAL